MDEDELPWNSGDNEVPHIDGPSTSYGYADRKWTDKHYVIVAPAPREKTKHGEPCQSKAMCLPCSVQSPRPAYIRSSTPDIVKAARKHICERHSVLEHDKPEGT